MFDFGSIMNLGRTSIGSERDSTAQSLRPFLFGYFIFGPAKIKLLAPMAKESNRRRRRTELQGAKTYHQTTTPNPQSV